MSPKKTQHEDKYTAVVIGAGRIAAGFDTPGSSDVLTHAHAYQKNPRIQLAGFFDSVPSMTKKAAHLWGGLAFMSLEEMLSEVEPDIVSICSPDMTHYQILKIVKNYKPRLIICEKPVVSNIKDLLALKKDLAFKTLPVLVNYSRRFDPSVQKIQHELSRGVYGKVISSRGIYTKGILHNGSHLIDLARFLFGEVTFVKALTRRMDYSATDPTVAAFLQLDRCPEFMLETGDERQYSMFELEIRCEKARLLFSDFGFTITTEKVTADPRYKGYCQLGKPVSQKTGLNRAMATMVTAAVEHLDTGSPLLSDLNNALTTQAVCAVLAKNISKS